jgi:hypothetical protein
MVYDLEKKLQIVQVIGHGHSHSTQGQQVETQATPKANYAKSALWVASHAAII